MQNPLVSIVIPVYNGSDYMREAIDSALAQTYQNIEVIVVNDGSRDDGATDRIARAYGDKIRYFAKTNGGVSSALNLGIREMTGDYFSWLSHDDVYAPDKIQKQVEALRQTDSPDNTIIYCGYLHIDRSSNLMSDRKIATYFETGKVYDSKHVLEKLLKKATFNGCCLLIPKKVFAECGGFDQRFRFCQDALMWYQIFMKPYSLVCIADPLVKNRIHEKQLTQTGQTMFRKECHEISYLLADEFALLSTPKFNFLRMYLLFDARYFGFRRVKEIVGLGQEYSLISKADAAKACLLCCYGHVRPLIRKMYYTLFRRMKTA